MVQKGREREREQLLLSTGAYPGGAKQRWLPVMTDVAKWLMGGPE